MQIFRLSLLYVAITMVASCQIPFVKEKIGLVTHFAERTNVYINDRDRCVGPVVMIFSGSGGRVSQVFYLGDDSRATYYTGFVPVTVQGYCDSNGDLRNQQNEFPLSVSLTRKVVEKDTYYVANAEFIASGNKGVRFSDKWARNEKYGRIANLDSAVFSRTSVRSGLWKPLEFQQNRLQGLYFAEPFDEKKAVVLFVHGISDTPLVFSEVYKNLDKTKYQAWFYFYPTGLPLSSSSGELLKLMGLSLNQYAPSRIHIVAHSMGGLVSLDYLRSCLSQGLCNNVDSFTSVSTPWGGHNSAKYGAKYASDLVPVWYDMAPGSEFLKRLYGYSLPSQVKHYLFVSIQQQDMLGFESNDGVVSMASMFNMKMQEQAHMIRAFNEGHVSILSNPDLMRHLDNIFVSGQPEQ